MAKYLSKRVKKASQVAITSDRYQFLGLDQAEPDLGDPIVGPSSYAANPLPPTGNQYVLAAYDNEPGSRYWVPTPNIQGAGLIPGSFTIFNNGVQVGLANSFNRFNFVGVAVTVDPVGAEPEAQTGIATVRIQVIDVVAPGDPYEIPYHDPVSGFLRGSDGFVYYNNNVGIGSTLPTQKLEIVGNVKIDGNINSGNIIAGVITATDVNAQNVYSGYIGVNTLRANIGIITSLFAQSGVVTFISGIGLTYTNATFTSIGSTTGIITSLTVRDLNVTGVTTLAQAKIGTGSTLVTITESGRIGINSVTPQNSLDVNGNIKLGGSIELSNGKGTVGQVIISNGTSPVSWANISETTVGSANSISITNTNDNNLYYPTFTREADKITNVYVDSTSLVYNPSTNRLGIGSTAPQYSLDVFGEGRFSSNIYVRDIVSIGSTLNELIRTSSGIVTTSSLNTISIDSIGINTYRSAKYTIQVTSKGNLGIGSITSIKNLVGGIDYYPGTYSNLSLGNISGFGTNARANITVNPQFSLGITTCSSGIFTFTGSAVGIATGQTIYFNNQLDILPLEQSKLTAIQLTSSGYGYTAIPTIAISPPQTLVNPVPGVSLGVSATAAVTSMNVKDFNISVGVVTTVYPTVIISSPTTGTTATGNVGVGVSEINVVNSGAGYTQSPSITISKLTGFSAIAGMGISSSNWQISGGSGYTSPPTITIVAQGGIGTDAVIEADVDADPPNGLINITITNPGYGYTVPPTVNITGGGGSSAEIIIKEMIVTNVDVVNIGSNATTTISNSDITVTGVGNVGSGATLSVSTIIPTNVDIINAGSGYTAFDIPVTATFSDPSITADVGLGVQAITLLTTGIGYTNLPTITFSPPTLSLGSTATATATTLGYSSNTVVYPGPSLGGTNYYITPVTSNSFRISDTKNGQTRSLGYLIPPGTIASVGGVVSTVDIIASGSNYKVNDVLTAINFDLDREDVNVGTGFNFSVNAAFDNFQISDLLLIQTSRSGIVTSYIIENIGISDYEDLVKFSTDIVDNNARLKITPTYAYNELKYNRTAFTI